MKPKTSETKAKKATRKAKGTAAGAVTKKGARGRRGRGTAATTAASGTTSGKGRGRPKSAKLRIVESESELEDDFNAFGAELTPDRVSNEPAVAASAGAGTAKEPDTCVDGDAPHKQTEVACAVAREPKQPIRKDDEPMQLLNWSQKVNLIGEKVVNPLIHCCDLCLRPILIYGRMIPCKHVFCLACGKQDLKQCPRCSEKIARVEQTGLGSVFMCTHDGSRYGNDGCRRTYLSQRDLQAHINHRHVFASKLSVQ